VGGMRILIKICSEDLKGRDYLGDIGIKVIYSRSCEGVDWINLAYNKV
jgi:hypothetical protein